MLGIALKNISEGLFEPEKLQLGNDYYISSDAFSMLMIANETHPATLIEGQILAWNFDSTFIIVKQKPHREIIDSIYNIKPNANYNELVKLYNENKTYYYWIIDKREELDSYYDYNEKIRKYTKGLYGPYTQEEYLEKRKELNVSDTLKLKEIEKSFFGTPFR